ncbi:hypothetical protein QDY65_10215 [Pyrococcus kukulkanii]|uniref:Uncharacterized protein n=1 Tax=Pyrococcus kukulkanii TaxID=1609559 RepID=A0A127BDK7_9EURY|nr:hypothetical protein [Pyrococcus kukulkanii]AMM54746.1 hypothetical protein TQ32_09805 [Pyrococcus kukulkanii]
MLVKSLYIGFKTHIGAGLAHIEGDFEVKEVVGEISPKAAHILRKRFPYITLADAPLIPLEELDERDRQLLIKALAGLKEDERLKIEWR